MSVHTATRHPASRLLNTKDVGVRRRKQNLRVERRTPEASPREVLDRILDKGIVFDASQRIAVAGIDLLRSDVVVTVVSIETHLRQAGLPPLAPAVPFQQAA
jgi:Gas vesicle protein